MISLKNLDCPYITKNNEQLFLRGINLSIDAGEIFAIIGRSESGRNALLRCMQLQERPHTGIVSIDNKNLVTMTAKDLQIEQRHIGYIHAKPQLLASKTIAQNVALPLLLQHVNKQSIYPIVDAVLKQVNLADKAHLYPHQLSHVQRIRATIARCLISQSKLLLCEDITAGLDQKSILSLTNLLQSLNQQYDLTIVILANDLELIKTLCKRVAILEQGEIIEQCSVFQLLATPNSSVAKDFIAATTRYELPWAYRRRVSNFNTKNNHPLIRFAFTGCTTPEKVLSNVIKQFQVKFNILQAHQESIEQQRINILIAELQGSFELVQKTLQYLNQQQLNNEIIGYVPNVT